MSGTEWNYVTGEMEKGVSGAAGRLPSVDFLDLTKTRSGHSRFHPGSTAHPHVQFGILFENSRLFEHAFFSGASQLRPHWGMNLGATVMWYGARSLSRAFK